MNKLWKWINGELARENEIKRAHHVEQMQSLLFELRSTAGKASDMVGKYQTGRPVEGGLAEMAAMIATVADVVEVTIEDHLKSYVE